MEANTMNYPIVRFPVKCPCCGQESLAREDLGFIANRFLDDRPIKLHAECEHHRVVWVASDIERNQIKDYAATAKFFVVARSHFMRRLARWLALSVRVLGTASNDSQYL
jgi:hypothetical protein